MKPGASAGGPLARTLPGRFYHDPAIWRLEQERLFGRLWVAVGRSDQFPAVGHYRTVRVGDESVLVVRGEDGALRALLNVCRHRGAQLCPAERGQTRTLQCRYHAWTYGLDGRLLRAPGLQDAPDFDKSAFGLVPVALDTWEGLVWVNLAENPPPVTDQILPQLADRLGDAARLAPYRMGALGVGRTLEYEIEANWKVIVENFMECYHCAPMHPELVRLLPAFRSGATQEYGLGTRLADDAEALTASGRAPAPPFPGLAPGHERHYYGMVVRPNVFLNLLPDHVIVHTLTPLAPDRSRVTCDWLFDSGVVARSDFDPTDTVEVFDRVNRQDWEVCEWVQAGVRSRAFAAGGVYVPIERHIRGFNDFVLAQRHLTASLGTLGATLVRFLYGLPFAALWFAVVRAAGTGPLPAPSPGFAGWVLLGAVCQIAATALLLRVMAARNFTLGVAYSKSELIQVAVFGLAFLGDPVSAGAAVAIALGTLGVLLLSPADAQRPVLRDWTTGPALLGLGSGAGFALAAVGYRGAALALGATPFLLAAAYTLVAAQLVQTVLLDGWLLARDAAIVTRVLRAWRASLFAGFMGAAASAGWFTAMAIEPVAHVRTLGLIELLFSYALSRRVFRERLSRRELVGVALLAVALVVVTLRR